MHSLIVLEHLLVGEDAMLGALTEAVREREGGREGEEKWKKGNRKG